MKFLFTFYAGYLSLPLVKLFIHKAFQIYCNFNKNVCFKIHFTKKILANCDL